MVSYIPLVAAKNAAIRPTPMHGAFSTDAYSNGCATNAVANSFVPFLRTTAIAFPEARRLRPELGEGVRLSVFGNYVVHEDILEIRHVAHGARDVADLD